MQQRARPLDMPQETVANTPALVRAFDEARNVGHDDLDAVDADDAQIGDQRRERVVGNLGSCVRRGRQKRRLAGVRHAQKADVGNQFESQPDRPLHPLLTGVCAARGLIGG